MFCGSDARRTNGDLDPLGSFLAKTILQLLFFRDLVLANRARLSNGDDKDSRFG